MKIGLIRTSLKENEKRLPIYPEHLPWIDNALRKDLFFETNYGEDYGFGDDYSLNLFIILQFICDYTILRRFL